MKNRKLRRIHPSPRLISNPPPPPHTNNKSKGILISSHCFFQSTLSTLVISPHPFISFLKPHTKTCKPRAYKWLNVFIMGYVTLSFRLHVTLLCCYICFIGDRLYIFELLSYIHSRPTAVPTTQWLGVISFSYF